MLVIIIIINVFIIRGSAEKNHETYSQVFRDRHCHVQILPSALSKCAGSWQFCRLQAIICHLLHTGIPEESPSRQKDPVLAV